MRFYIKEAREAAGYSQKELAEIIGVAPNTFHGYESGKHDPKSFLLTAIAEACGVSTDFLLGLDRSASHRSSQLDDSDYSQNEEDMIEKYRALDEHGKKMVDFTLTEESSRMRAAQTALEEQAAGEPEPVYLYTLTEYTDPMSAGTGQPAGDGYGETLLLTKQPPRGTSYVAHIAGDSMEPTYRHGDRLFIQACYSINVGEVGVFLMDGQQWVKELGEGVLLSHNPAYSPRPMTADIRCQGRVLGVCDASYF